MTELVGTFGSIFILISMCFSTKTKKGTILLRTLNFIGSVIYIYYGILIDAFNVIFLNVFMIIANLYYIIKEFQNNS